MTAFQPGSPAYEALIAERAELRADNERLRALLREAANEIDELGFPSKADRFLSAGTQAMTDMSDDALATAQEALQRIEQWSEAYPIDIFPEPDLKKARALLEAGGITLDAISAHCMRHVVEGVGEIARRGRRPFVEQK